MPTVPHLRLQGITVRYGPLTALDAIDLDLPPGSRIAVLGENGAGKSTLARVLSGARVPDSGTVQVDGVPVRFRSPRDAARHGIGIVPQHDELVPALTVAENVALGREPRRLGIAWNRRAVEAQIRSVADDIGFALNPRERVGNLSVGGRQRAAIVNALCRGARVLILDEPAAVLSPIETQELWGAVDRLAMGGASILFITHRLSEAIAQAHEVAVLRRGHLVHRSRTDQTDAAALAAAVIGDGSLPSPPERPHRPIGGVRAMIPWPGAEGSLALPVRSGEIVGFAGVDGSGGGDCVDSVVGLRSGPGGLQLDGADADGWSVARRRAWGMALVPEDRHRDALALPMTLEENIALGRHRDAPFARWGSIVRGARRRALAKAVERFDIRGVRPGLPAAALSGGNQQKLVLARELAQTPRLLVAIQPTRGLDFFATAQVRNAIRSAAQDGAAVLLASADIDELRELADRVVVFHAGRVRGILAADDADDERLGSLMTGRSET